MRVHVVDPALFTLPYDIHFCHAMAGKGAEVVLIGRGLRSYEQVGDQGFAFRPLFYRRSENAVDTWQTSAPRKILKGLEHVTGMRALERLAQRERPDILHLQWFVLPIVDRFFLRRIGRRAGLVLTVHDSQSFHGSSNSSWLQVLGDREARLLFDHYIVHTEQTRDTLRKLGIEGGRITTIAHPPLPLAEPRAAAQPASGGAVRILFFGSIKHYKGVDVLVDAGLALAAAGIDFVIEIVGRPFESVDDLEAKIAAAGLARHFRFDLRYIPDEALTAYLQAADIVVFPYRKIDASGALALAIEAEKPIVATDIGVFAEIPARQHLFLVKPDDTDDLARALRTLVEDPAAREELRQQTRQLKAGIGSWRKFAGECLAIYSRLLGDRSSGAHPPSQN
jgi:glycosyltransferase involved in cell wall biosynthesis